MTSSDLTEVRGESPALQDGEDVNLFTDIQTHPSIDVFSPGREEGPKNPLTALEQQ